MPLSTNGHASLSESAVGAGAKNDPCNSRVFIVNYYP